VGFFRTRIASQNKKRKAVVVILLRVEDPLGAGSAELNSQVLTRVNPLSPNHRFVIALHLLGGVFEPDRQGNLRRKGHEGRLTGWAGRFLQSGLKGKSPELRQFLAIFREMQRGFSAYQTAWRSGRDSNPRYGFRPLSPEVVVSYREQNPSREFRTETRR
jgi:hypothetical protein